MKKRYCFYLALAAAIPFQWVAAQGASTASSGSSFLDDTKLSLNTRVRYEGADMDGLASADAFTVRARLALQTGVSNGLSAYLDFEVTESLNGEDNYDAYPGGQGTSGLTPIFDPESRELNQAFIKYDGGDLSTRIGRQRIILDNARFIGNVGWRQNEQTFDAVQISGSPSEQLKWSYAYIDRVQRIFGSEAVVTGQRKFDSQSHILNANYKASSDVTLAGYAYLLDLEQAAAASSSTYGAYMAGSFSEELSYRFEAAMQSDYGDNPNRYTASYVHASLSGKIDTLTATAGFERLGSDGGVGFSTPLATLHAFNGFADAYLGTPNGGLEDVYLKGVIAMPGDIKATLAHHWFSGTQGGFDAGGTEIDIVLAKKFSKEVSGVIKYADYNGKRAVADRSKIWIQVDLSY